MLPALYTAYFQHTDHGSPVARPIFWDALGDSAALATENEYLLGDHILVAPVLDSGARSRTVYLPAGRWYRMGSGELNEGGRSVKVSAPDALTDEGDTTGLRGLPVFIRAGAVVPSQAVLSYEGQRKIDTLELHVYPGSATSQLYEDAGDGYGYVRGERRVTSFHTTATPQQLIVLLSRDGSYAGVSYFQVTVHDVDRPRRTTLDGNVARADYNGTRRELRFVMPSTARRIEIER
jgi:alpha-glucosidase